MIVASLVLLAQLQAPLPLDTPVVQRPRAVEYSDSYYTRLTIHRISSYTMLPLFVGEYSLGQNLINDAAPPGWMKPAHAAVASGIGILFTVNTVTGLWNLWEARQDPDGRARRTVHSILMLPRDGGVDSRARGRLHGLRLLSAPRECASRCGDRILRALDHRRCDDVVLETVMGPFGTRA